MKKPQPVQQSFGTVGRSKNQEAPGNKYWTIFWNK